MAICSSLSLFATPFRVCRHTWIAALYRLALCTF
jgi:hypothetical protein